MTQIKEATAYHKYLMQENEGDIQRIANQICMDIMDYNNPQAFELMDATGDRAFCDETLKKAAQIVIDLCTPVENKEVLVEGEGQKYDYTTDTKFWVRLRMFVMDVQVNDLIGEEEKAMILSKCEKKILAKL